MALAWQLAVTVGLISVATRWWIVEPAPRYLLGRLAGCVAGCTIWLALFVMIDRREILALELVASIALLALLPLELRRGRG